MDYYLIADKKYLYVKKCKESSRAIDRYRETDVSAVEIVEKIGNASS